MLAKRSWYPFEKMSKDKIIRDGLACGRSREKKEEAVDNGHTA